MKNLLKKVCKNTRFFSFVSKNFSVIEWKKNDFFFSKIGLMTNSVSISTDYNRLSVKIEQMSKFIRYTLVDLTFTAMVLPPIILTSINYFIYDLNDESYFLPFPVTYVFFSLFSQSNENIFRMKKNGKKSFLAFFFLIFFFD